MDGYRIDAAMVEEVVEVGASAIEEGIEFVMLVVVGGNGLVRFEVKVAGGYEGADEEGSCCGCGRDSECDR